MTAHETRDQSLLDGACAQEGVIQYQLDFRLDQANQSHHLPKLNGWRSYLYRLGLIGQDPKRYGGLGYGNLSHRLKPGHSGFLISGTQTGHLPLLCREHYVLVERADTTKNQIVAHGPIKPSSEALTHAALYQANQAVHSVLHVHSPLIWRNARAMKLPVTPADVPYGTPAMASAVQDCMKSRPGLSGAIVMAGHEDGVIVYSDELDSAGALLLELLMWANDVDVAGPGSTDRR